jgi:hypothetical protein
MPFFPSQQQVPQFNHTRNLLKLQQEIALMDMQAGYKIKQTQEEHDRRMKELDKAYSHEKMLAEEKWEREEPLRRLKYDVERLKAVEQDHKLQLKAKDRRYNLFKDEQDLKHQGSLNSIKALNEEIKLLRIKKEPSELDKARTQRIRKQTEQIGKPKEPSELDKARTQQIEKEIEQIGKPKEPSELDKARTQQIRKQTEQIGKPTPPNPSMFDYKKDYIENTMDKPKILNFERLLKLENPPDNPLDEQFLRIRMDKEKNILYEKIKRNEPTLTRKMFDKILEMLGVSVTYPPGAPYSQWNQPIGSTMPTTPTTPTTPTREEMDRAFTR